MNLSKTSQLLVLTFSLLLTATALAADAHKGSLETFDALQVNGTALPAGNYQVQWEGAGPDVHVSILKGRKVVATSQGRIVELNQKLSQDSVVAKENGDGSKSISEIRFGGKRFALALGGEEAAQSDSKTATGSK